MSIAPQDNTDDLTADERARLATADLPPEVRRFLDEVGGDLRPHTTVHRQIAEAARRIEPAMLQEVAEVAAELVALAAQCRPLAMRAQALRARLDSIEADTVNAIEAASGPAPYAYGRVAEAVDTMTGRPALTCLMGTLSAMFTAGEVR